MREASAVAQSSLSLPTDSYVYIVRPLGDNLAAICSDDSLRILDASTLQSISGRSVPRTHTSVTCLDGGNESFPYCTTAGRDGLVKAWDNRSDKSILEFMIDGSVPILSLAVDPTGDMIAAGTELTHQQAIVHVWDYRAPREPLLRYVECHNDDVTELCWHPTRPSRLLSGSTDGLVNIYDTTIQDEDDALLQVINHGSIHHAGFLSDTLVYALSHDEVFSIYPGSDSSEIIEAEEPVTFGDLRTKADCEYVVDILHSEAGAIVAAGTHSQQRLDLAPLRSSPTWELHAQEAIRLNGAHGEEIVRSIYIDHKSSTIYTGGEDGLIRAWKTQDENPNRSVDQVTPSARNKKKRDSILKDKHFKPY